MYEMRNIDRNTYYTSQCLESLRNFFINLQNDIHFMDPKLVEFAEQL